MELQWTSPYHYVYIKFSPFSLWLRTPYRSFYMFLFALSEGKFVPVPKHHTMKAYKSVEELKLHTLWKASDQVHVLWPSWILVWIRTSQDVKAGIEPRPFSQFTGSLFTFKGIFGRYLLSVCLSRIETGSRVV